jgi:hypothetical protein
MSASSAFVFDGPTSLVGSCWTWAFLVSRFVVLLVIIIKTLGLRSVAEALFLLNTKGSCIAAQNKLYLLPTLALGLSLSSWDLC